MREQVLLGRHDWDSYLLWHISSGQDDRLTPAFSTSKAESETFLLCSLMHSGGDINLTSLQSSGPLPAHVRLPISTFSMPAAQVACQLNPLSVLCSFPWKLRNMLFANAPSQSSFLIYKWRLWCRHLSPPTPSLLLSTEQDPKMDIQYVEVNITTQELQWSA